MSIKVVGLPASGAGAVSLRLAASPGNAGRRPARDTVRQRLDSPTLRSEVARTVVATAVVQTAGGGKVTLTATHTMTVDVSTVGLLDPHRSRGTAHRLGHPDPRRRRQGVGQLPAARAGHGHRRGPGRRRCGAWLSITASSTRQTSVTLPTVRGGSGLAQLVVPAGRSRSTAVYVPLAASGAVNVAANHLASRDRRRPRLCRGR